MKCIVVAALCLLTLACTSANAAEDKDEWIRGKLFVPEVILRSHAKLKLTEQQRAAIGTELKRVQAAAADLDWQIMSEGIEVQEQIAKYPVDKPAVLTRVERVLAAENRKKLLYFEMLVNLKNLLSREQIDVLKAESAQQ